MSLKLEELNADNLQAAVSLSLKPGQEKYVAPVVHSIAQAYVTPTAWPRVILDQDQVVGFIMGNFDPENEIEAFRAGIWRLNVSGEDQGRGVGKFAVQALADEARSRGAERITVLWVPGEDGPEKFYLKCGFVPTGEILFGETVGVLKL
ncbi:GNAT family N-acetyltransferase [Bacillus horti]|uniref:Diamine N-acetyltransferase n=1 Tax=Caldalkalibacillus horti TaxID=77523 RepID=A0ABT9VV74_9BACI|nr:GNAT family N-acetyltransferase [Bacillus horti]MDQ0164780.1 diamine N-acetyltransferase [Bacillus horti]